MSARHPIVFLPGIMGSRLRFHASEKFWGRPADVQVAPDGSLLVSDDVAGAIFRIAYKK